MKKFNRIGEVLKEQGRTQKWLASKVGRTRIAINAVCQNIHQPSLKLLFKIAEILDVPTSELLGDGTDITQKH